MASNTDIIELLSTDADQAVDQIIEDAKRLNIVVNGTGTEQAITEDGSLIPSVRKALLDNLYFKTPPAPWRNGGSVSEFNQLYSFTDVSGNTTWWYAPGATASNPVVMRDSPINDGKFRVFLDKTNISDVYAPIVSPNFKGNPRVPLAVTGDETSTIASTAWVQREMKDLRDKIVSSTQGDFENITVKNDAVLHDTFIDGEFVVTSDKLSATNTEATFRRIRMVGSGTSTSNLTEIAFEQNAAAPTGISTKTNIRPYRVATGQLVSDTAEVKSAQVGDVAVATDSLNVDGYMRADYLHLEGNNRNTTDRPQLIVGGIAEIETLRVTGTIEGVKADVDGLNIKPNSINVTEGLQVGKDSTLAGKLSVTGKTTVKDIEVTGTLSGAAISVDGKDISPKSVRTGNVIATGDVQISGTTTATGKITTQDLEVLGKLTATLDLSGSDLSVDNLNVGETATIKDLVVTGSTTGVKADVDGENISPATVKASGNISADTLNTVGNATVGGDLAVTGQFNPSSLETGVAGVDELNVSGDINQTTGTARLVNLEVTGTVKGIKADVNGTAISPASADVTGDVFVGGVLSVEGKTTLKDVDFTGTVTGLKVDLSDQNVQTLSVTASQPSQFTDISTDTINNSDKITTKDIQVTGDILDAEGNPVNTFDVTNKDILPNSVQSATFVKTDTLRVESTSVMKGKVEFQDGLTVSAGDILATTGKATLNDLQVNGALTDANGNAIGTAESISGKDITPRSVVAEVSVEAARLESSGDILGKSLVIEQGASLGTLDVTGVTTLADVRVSGPLQAKEANLDKLTLNRVAGQDTARLVVEGDSDLQGDLNVTGTITGIIDLSAQDIDMNSLTLAQDLSARNVTASATVTGANGVFGQGSQGQGQYGLQSMSSARVATDLDVGNDLSVDGDLVVQGNITGTIDLGGKAITPDTVTANTVIATDATITNLNVTGTVQLPDSPVVVESITADTATVSGAVSAGKYSTTPKSGNATAATYTPDGTTSVYNVSVQAATEVQAPAGLLTSGKAESIFMFFEQDTTGHAVTFSSAFVVHNSATVSATANAITIANLVYRGTGNLIDVFLTGR